MRKLKEFVNYVESQIIKQILEDESIEVFLKASIGIGKEYFGQGTVFDIYVDDKDFQKALNIIENFEKGGTTLQELKRTPLFERHIQLGAKMGEFAGWELPLWYSSILEEHNAVRSSVGIFDVSHMGEIFVEGKQAEDFVNYLITNNVKKIKEGEIVYSPMCNENGGIIDDLLAYKFSSSKILLVVNAGNTEKDFQWINSHKNHFDVSVTNKSEEVCQIAFQGPKSQSQLQKYLEDVLLDDIEYYTFKVVKVEGEDIILSRTGYTGEDGFEIYSSVNIVSKLWDKLLDLAKEIDGKPCGLGSRDTLRFEAKLLLYGNDIDENTTPLEATLKWTIDFEKDFIGKKALINQQEEGIKRKLVGIEIFDKMPVRHGYEVYNENEKIGYITSGLKSPTLQKNLALGYVNIPFSKIGTKLTIKAKNKDLEAQVVKTPFYKGSVKSKK